jgi:type IV/VI secretion system ImpK/VasF family protein
MRQKVIDAVYPVVEKALHFRSPEGKRETTREQAVAAFIHGLLGLRELDEEIRRADPIGAEYHGMRYAVVSWLDEVFVADEAWGEQWKEQTLERTLFDTRDRADKFWVLAEDALSKGKLDAIEVFLTVACLGFRGNWSAEQRRQWVVKALTLLPMLRGQAPPAKRPEPVSGRPKTGLRAPLLERTLSRIWVGVALGWVVAGLVLVIHHLVP